MKDSRSSRRSAKQQRLKNLILSSWRNTSCRCRKGTPLFRMIASMKWIRKVGRRLENL